MLRSGSNAPLQLIPEAQLSEGQHISSTLETEGLCSRWRYFVYRVLIDAVAVRGPAEGRCEGTLHPGDKICFVSTPTHACFNQSKLQNQWGWFEPVSSWIFDTVSSSPKTYIYCSPKETTTFDRFFKAVLERSNLKNSIFRPKFPCHIRPTV